MHIPMFVEDSKEQDQYFNIPKTTREQLLLKFSDAGISKIFCGHFHRNAGGLWTSEKDPSKKVCFSLFLNFSYKEKTIKQSFRTFKTKKPFNHQRLDMSFKLSNKFKNFQKFI